MTDLYTNVRYQDFSSIDLDADKVILVSQLLTQYKHNPNESVSLGILKLDETWCETEVLCNILWQYHSWITHMGIDELDERDINNDGFPVNIRNVINRFGNNVYLIVNTKIYGELLNVLGVVTLSTEHRDIFHTVLRARWFMPSNCSEGVSDPLYLLLQKNNIFSVISRYAAIQKQYTDVEIDFPVDAPNMTIRPSGYLNAYLNRDCSYTLTGCHLINRASELVQVHASTSIKDIMILNHRDIAGMNNEMLMFLWDAFFYKSYARYAEDMINTLRHKFLTGEYSVALDPSNPYRTAILLRYLPDKPVDIIEIYSKEINCNNGIYPGEKSHVRRTLNALFKIFLNEVSECLPYFVSRAEFSSDKFHILTKDYGFHALDNIYQRRMRTEDYDAVLISTLT
jgi:hypothetical protein